MYAQVAIQMGQRICPFCIILSVSLYVLMAHMRISMAGARSATISAALVRVSMTRVPLAMLMGIGICCLKVSVLTHVRIAATRTMLVSVRHAVHHVLPALGLRTVTARAVRSTRRAGCCIWTTRHVWLNALTVKCQPTMYVRTARVAVRHAQSHHLRALLAMKDASFWELLV